MMILWLSLSVSQENTKTVELKMRAYYMGFLYRGPNWTAEQTPEAIAASEGHMKNIKQMAMNGKLLIAGPFNVPEGAPKNALAGIFIFDVNTMEEALALTKSDPAVIAGRFTIDVKEWYAPVGITYTNRLELIEQMKKGE
ncbi:MAG: hypothetical protein KDD94_15280 [Calditrichaeota bacterium]|nr:hypothetical protein [Calditrichota bacterium]